jgi:hypothetical protein
LNTKTALQLTRDVVSFEKCQDIKVVNVSDFKWEKQAVPMNRSVKGKQCLLTVLVFYGVSIFLLLILQEFVVVYSSNHFKRKIRIIF